MSFKDRDFDEKCKSCISFQDGAMGGICESCTRFSGHWDRPEDIKVEDHYDFEPPEPRPYDTETCEKCVHFADGDLIYHQTTPCAECPHSGSAEFLLKGTDNEHLIKDSFFPAVQAQCAAPGCEVVVGTWEFPGPDVGPGHESFECNECNQRYCSKHSDCSGMDETGCHCHMAEPGEPK